MKNNGFTLIELLAVIVILAIIALIATPIVLNIIKNTRESAGLRSAEMYLDAVEQSVSIEKMNNTTFKPNSCTIEKGNLNCEGYDKNPIEVKVNGEVPNSGKITFENGKIKDITLNYSNGKTIVKNDGKLVYSDEENENGKVEYTAYVVGDEVTVGGESFYVIADSDETESTVTLLAKDNIDTTNLVQSASAATVAFSKTNYWSSDFTSSPYDLTETGEPDASHYAAKAAYDYGAKVGGTGRLMTHSEAKALQSVNSDILYGKNGKSSGIYLRYWLGSANSAKNVWCVRGNGGLSVSGDMGWGFYSYNEGVRPVVEILKANIS